MTLVDVLLLLGVITIIMTNIVCTGVQLYVLTRLIGYRKLKQEARQSFEEAYKAGVTPADILNAVQDVLEARREDDGWFAKS